MGKASRSLRIRHDASFFPFVAFIALIFLIGGGSRADIQSLLLLYPVVCVFLAFGLVRINRPDVRMNASVVILLFFFPMLALIQLIPLPPLIWTNLPGRDWIADLDSSTSVGNIWRPVNLTPDLGLNAFFAFLLPLTVVLWLIRLRSGRAAAILSLVLFMGLVSAVLSVFQIMGPERNWLHFYSINNPGATGLFSNRNHQALLLGCLLPMLPVWCRSTARTEEQWKARFLGSLSVAAFLVPLVLLTGSRAGLGAALIGIIGAYWLFDYPKGLVASRRRGGREFGYRAKIGVVTGLLLVTLAGITIVASRAQALDRLLGASVSGDARIHVWKATWFLILDYFPVGTGFGSFEGAYKMVEGNSNLSRYYMNHAHNDLLELLLEGGALAAVGLLVAGVLWSRRAATIIWYKGPPHAAPDQFAKLGLVLTFILSLGSLFDYPLRVPSLAALFTISLFWMFRPAFDRGMRPIQPEDPA